MLLQGGGDLRVKNSKKTSWVQHQCQTPFSKYILALVMIKTIFLQVYYIRNDQLRLFLSFLSWPVLTRPVQYSDLTCPDLTSPDLTCPAWPVLTWLVLTWPVMPWSVLTDLTCPDLPDYHLGITYILSRHPLGTFQTPLRHPPDTCQTSTRHPPDNFQRPSRHPQDSHQSSDMKDHSSLDLPFRYM